MLASLQVSHKTLTQISSYLHAYYAFLVAVNRCYLLAAVIKYSIQLGHFDVSWEPA